MSFIAYQIVIRWFQNKKVSEPFPPELQSSAVLINLVAKIKTGQKPRSAVGVPAPIAVEALTDANIKTYFYFAK